MLQCTRHKKKTPHAQGNRCQGVRRWKSNKCKLHPAAMLGDRSAFQKLQASWPRHPVITISFTVSSS